MMLDHKQLEEYLQNQLPYYLKSLERMVKINSFTANPQGVNRLGAFTSELFSKLDFEPEYIQSTNNNFGKHLFLRRKAKGINQPSLALISHLDTVYTSNEEIQNDFSWKQVGDKIYGPGVVDIKGGTIMILMIVEALHDRAPELFDAINWLICLDASEEALSDDFGQHCLIKLPADTLGCLVFEGGTLSKRAFPLVVARKGRATFAIEVKGRSAHSGNAHARGANAIVQLSHTIQKVSALTNYQEDITFNVGEIQGGSVINRVPHEAKAKVEMRAFLPLIFEDGIEKMLSFAGETDVYSADGYPCEVSVHLLQRTHPWPINQKTEFLFSIWEQTGASIGYRIAPESRGGLSDGNMLWETFPVLDGLGPTGANSHCSERTLDGSKDQEYVLISSFVPKAKLNILALGKLLGAI